MEINQILKYKKELMGFSTLAILFAHFMFSNSWIIYFEHMLSCCVDIFLIVSGVGCYFSIQKHSVKEFYTRRFIRIFPFYILVIICYGLYYCLREGQSVAFFIVHNEAFLSMFLYGEITGWFFVAITIFYLLTPLINKLMKKQWYYAAWLMGIIWVVSAQLEFYLHDSLYMVNNFIVVRFPAYLLGMIVGYFLNEDRNIKIPMKVVYVGEIVSVILMIINIAFNTIDFGLIIKILATPYGFFTALLLTKLFEKIPTKFFAFFGSISLEAYLSFEKILGIFEWDIGIIINPIVTDIVAAIITTIFAVIFKCIFDLIFYKKVSLI